MNLHRCVLAITFLASWMTSRDVSAGPATVSEEAGAILKKVIEDMGGDAALSKVKGMRWQSKGTYKMGQVEMPFTAETTFVFPDSILWKLESSGFREVMGMRGGVAWSQMMAPPARAAGAAKKSMSEWPDHFKTMLVRPLLDLDGVKISVPQPPAAKEEPKAEGSRARPRVRVEFADGRKFDLVFGGREKLALAVFRGDTTLMDGRKGRLESKVSEPRKFGDVTLPSVSDARSLFDEKVEESFREEITSIEWNPKVSDDAFKMPDPGVQFMKPAVKKTEELQGIALVHKGAYDKMGETFYKLMEVCRKLELMQSGPTVTVYLNDPNSVKDPSELMTRVIQPVMISGDPPKSLPEGASFEKLPAAEVVSVMARGTYGKADVEALHKAFAWAGANGYQFSGAPWTLYYHDPKLTVEEDLVSEAQVPVQKK
jgi:effector-binding domain-containing protein